MILQVDTPVQKMTWRIRRVLGPKDPPVTKPMWFSNFLDLAILDATMLFFSKLVYSRNGKKKTLQVKTAIEIRVLRSGHQHFLPAWYHLWRRVSEHVLRGQICNLGWECTVWMSIVMINFLGDKNIWHQTSDTAMIQNNKTSRDLILKYLHSGKLLR